MLAVFANSPRVLHKVNKSKRCQRSHQAKSASNGESVDFSGLLCCSYSLCQLTKAHFGN